MEIHVDVTQEDIENGKGHEGEYDKCPVCCSLKRLGCTDLNIDENRMIFTKDTTKYLYITPRVVDLFIDDFDNNRPVKPFKFIINNPIKTINIAPSK
jgi:hypothetical protein